MTPAEDFRTKYLLSQAAEKEYTSADNAVALSVHDSLEYAQVASDEDTTLSIDADSTANNCKLLIVEVENTDATDAILVTLGSGFAGEAMVVKAEEFVRKLFIHDGTNYVEVELAPKADVQAPTYAATMALVVKAKETLVTQTATGDVALNVADDADWDSTDGDKIYIKLTASGANRTITPGTNCTGAAIVVTSAKTNVITLVKFGANWVVSNNQQVD